MFHIVDTDDCRCKSIDEEVLEAEDTVKLMISQFLEDTGKMPNKLYVSKSDDFSSLYGLAGILFELEVYFVDKDYSWVE